MNKCTIWGGHLSKKAFTLIELLAVIVILAIIALIAVPIVLNTINDTKESSIERSAELYEKAVLNAVIKEQLDGKTQIEEWKYTVQSDESICIIYNGSCKEGTKIKIEVDGEKPEEGGTLILKDNKIMEAHLTISGKLVKKDDRTNGKYAIVGEKIPQVAVSCEYSNEGTKGSVGSKYHCDVDPNIEENYYFYILETNATKTTLLMDRNLGETVAWMSNEDFASKHPTRAEELKYDGDVCESYGYCAENTDGFITLQRYLEEQTSSWTNSGMRVGIPSVSQLAKVSGNNTEDYYTESIPNWLYVNLNKPPYGYWTADASIDYSTNAWLVNFRGRIGNSSVARSDYYGFRPVITISTSALN